MGGSLSERARLYGEIETERQQYAAEYPSEHDDRNTPWHWVGLLTRLLGVSLPHDRRETFDPQRWRKALVRCIALLVAALEAHDRAYSKVAGKHEPGSGF